MNSRDLKSYVKILKAKAKELLRAIPEADVTSDLYRSLIVNFNNTYATIQEFKNVIETMDDSSDSE